MTGAFSVGLDEPVCDADVLVNGTTHIGLLAGDGSVVQAEQASKGVHADSKYAASDWTVRLRIPDSFYWF